MDKAIQQDDLCIVSKKKPYDKYFDGGMEGHLQTSGVGFTSKSFNPMSNIKNITGFANMMTGNSKTSDGISLTLDVCKAVLSSGDKLRIWLAQSKMCQTCHDTDYRFGKCVKCILCPATTGMIRDYEFLCRIQIRQVNHKMFAVDVITDLIYGFIKSDGGDNNSGVEALCEKCNYTTPFKDMRQPMRIKNSLISNKTDIRDRKKYIRKLMYELEKQGIIKIVTCQICALSFKHQRTERKCDLSNCAENCYCTQDKRTCTMQIIYVNGMVHRLKTGDAWSVIKYMMNTFGKKRKIFTTIPIPNVTCPIPRQLENK